VAIQSVAAQVVGGQQVPNPVRAGIGRPPPATRPRVASTAARPLPARVGLEVERAELVHADDYVRVSIQNVVGAVHQPVQVQDPVLLGFEIGIVALLPGLDHLKGHALLAE
jgi:hypothetical protein